LALPPPPPHPASARVSNNPEASGTIVDSHRLTPGWFRRPMAHAIAVRTKASINKPLRRGNRGETGGSGRKRGALTEAAVVVTLTVTFVAELPGVNGLGETVQVASDGAPEQVKLMLWLNPPSPATLKVYVADCPGATAAEVEEPEAAASVKSWPVPLSATLCGLPGPSSEMLRVPVRVPPAAGLKVTEMVQLAPALTVLPQVLVWEKSPLAVMLERVSEALPVLVSATVCAPLLVPTNCPEKVSEEEDKLTPGPIPVPVKVTV